ncbi:CDP-diacylglycerol--glycerol-3-phosphate 3-phosphatidyltransferase [Mycoplasmopsis sturni]|uniref:CDP-diacylglycerol--glycerol-3-phosphate 3-phosphatidyltransferase n=1 Tax=Mycoplasmopsis sturni TaxID=39047 RepID=UPI000690A7B8|nr:CDP-diacylglycerol--glycerol-3-phosphate 3-phosphatidyltransferase [Mycoplasmopsis sturni]
MPKHKIPNLLTFVRICLAFLSVIFILPFGFDLFSELRIYFYKFGYTIFLLIIFSAAMITDFVDGYLARKWNVVSSFGKLWDPLADKMITIVALIYLLIINMFNPALVILIVIRDLVVDGSRVIMSKNNIEIQASKLAKIKTFYISIIILFALLLASIYQGINVGIIKENLNDANFLGAIPEFSFFSYTKYLEFVSNLSVFSSNFSQINFFLAISIINFLTLLGGVIISYISGIQYLLKIKLYFLK